MKTTNYLLATALVLFLSGTAWTQNEPAGKRLLVVSGGGARGAWGVGMAQYLHDSLHHRYHTVIGTSTGALMAPFILLQRFDDLAKAYTSVRQCDIFNKNPFNRRGEPRLFKALFRLGKPSLGESLPLKRLIPQFMSRDLYAQIQNSPDSLRFGVAVANLRTYEVHYKFSNTQPYGDMVNWMWASSNEPVFMTLFDTTNAQGARDYWVDGGVRDNVPVYKGLTLALDDTTYSAVDVIINNLSATEDVASTWPLSAKGGKARLFGVLYRTLTTFRNGIRDQNTRSGQLLERINRSPLDELSSSVRAEPMSNTSKSTLKLTFYILPKDCYELIPNDLLFDPDKMRTLLEHGRRGRFVPVSELMPGSVPLEIQSALSDRAMVMPSASPAVDASKGAYSIEVSREALRKVLKQLDR